MIEKLFDRMNRINPWHFVWISVVCSEIITFGLNVLQSRLWRDGVSAKTLLIGAVDALVVPLIVATFVIFFVKRAAELGKINAQLEEANQKLQELDSLKSEFVSTASHELRTPLTTIKAFVELITMKPGMPEQRKAKLLAGINREVDRLSRLITDLLDLGRIESGSLNWRVEQLYIEDLIKNSVVVMTPLFEHRGLSVFTSFNAERRLLTGDPDRLSQVLTNLLSNAIRFTKPGGSIGITVRGEMKQVLVEISDTGTGIAAEDLESIFEKFRRSGSESAGENEGTGLGLAITRQIVEYHGGRIWATSTSSGSTFSFTLPVSEVAQPDALSCKPLTG
jgi:signal transduction histidine kinase